MTEEGTGHGTGTEDSLEGEEEAEGAKDGEDATGVHSE